MRQEEYSRIVVRSGVFAALVFAATLVAVSTPITNGYFNLGESMVYTAALLGGPMVGALAGGVGSALADLYLGYAHYAPGTLVIKGVEGYLAGLLFERLSRLSRERLRSLALPLAVLTGGAVVLSGVLLYGALYGGDTVLEVWGRSLEFRIPLWAWAGLGAAVGLIVVYSILRWSPVQAAALASILVAGSEMVAGYFLYEALVLGYGITAAAEIPVNIGQVIIGASIAYTIVTVVRRAGYD